MKSTIIAVYIVFIGSKLDCNGIEVNAKNNRKEVDKCFDDQRKDTYSFVRSLSHGLMSIETNSAEEKRRVKSALRDVETALLQNLFTVSNISGDSFSNCNELDPQKGDLIEFKRSLYRHWAVFVGSGRVVHLTPEEDGVYRYLNESLVEVAGSDLCRVNNLDNEALVRGLRARDVNSIVESANSVVGQSAEFDTIHCEHLNPQTGDLIEFQRRWYSHWGVYVGSGQVVHLTPTPKGDYRYLNESMVKVADSHLCRVNNLFEEAVNRGLMARDVDSIVESANLLVGRAADFDTIQYNCEHFVTECRYGKGFSAQSDGFNIPIIREVLSFVGHLFFTSS
ncbi:unnamed protein product [Oppiella nova]|uniref:LRAT domain-containing protein n=1 Tax=Oppiella nova TaxID=334625 RepID=A0A7R9LWP3_9ACAR|nr:unnamed protein product [Oppiella nova]CAG2167721.1 unnamed protein product [Oppiella nova]